MITAALLLLAATAVVQDVDQPGPDDIVVVALPNRKCEVRLADKILSDADFHARARRWAAGEPARVFLSKGSNLQCRVKIVRQLEDWGVRLVEFVDPSAPDGGAPPSAAAPALPAPTVSLPRPARSTPEFRQGDTADDVEISPVRLRLLAGKAAHLIARGDCQGALKLMLEAGDLDSAAKVVGICRARQ